MRAKHGMHWFRHENGTRNDPKLKRLTCTQRGIFYQLLEIASEDEDRGGFDPDDLEVLADDLGLDDVGLLQETLDLLVHRSVLRRVEGRLVFVRWDDYQGVSDEMREARREAGRRSGAARRTRSANICSTRVPETDDPPLNICSTHAPETDHMLTTPDPSQGNICSASVPENEHRLNIAEHTGTQQQLHVQQQQLHTQQRHDVDEGVPDDLWLVGLIPELAGPRRVKQRSQVITWWRERGKPDLAPLIQEARDYYGSDIGSWPAVLEKTLQSRAWKHPPEQPGDPEVRAPITPGDHPTFAALKAELWDRRAWKGRGAVEYQAAQDIVFAEASEGQKLLVVTHFGTYHARALRAHERTQVVHVLHDCLANTPFSDWTLDLTWDDTRMRSSA